jgi:hypothetical protein
VTASRYMPTPHLRRFATELSRLHTAAKIGADQLQRQTDVSPATVHRVTTARTCPQRRTVVALLDAYGTGDLQRTAVLALHAKAVTEQTERRAYPPGLPEEYVTYIAYEAITRRLLNWEAQFVPGLLQTPEYTRATIQGVRPTIPPSSVHHRVEARANRQGRLTGADPLQFAAIMDEAALWREVGGPLLMSAQLRHLQTAAAQPNITLQVVPYGAGAHPGMIGTFAVLRFADPEDPDVVYIDSSMEKPFFLDAASDVERYTATFADLQRAALSPDDSLDLIATAIAAFADEEETA